MAIDPSTLPASTLHALTVWGEARGEPIEGQLGVAWVIQHRASHPRWWGTSVASVCLRPLQFTCWKVGDPNREKMLALAERGFVGDGVWPQIEWLVQGLEAGKLLDNVANADHYVTKTVAPHTGWTQGREPVAALGKQLFYRIELPSPLAKAS